MRVGMIGLGAMGEGIVPRLMVAGHTITGWNRTKSKGEALIAQGMKWANTPREVAEQSDVVMSIVTDADAVKNVALGPDGVISGLSKDAVYLDMSTISPESSRAVAFEFKKMGKIMMDAPLSGSTVTLMAGKASFMVGGDKDER